MKEYGHPKTVRTKADGSSQTDSDPEVEIDLKRLLTFLNPNIGIVGEETGIEGNADTYWLIDPIDSTNSFKDGKPFCTNMVALMHKGEPIFSIIFEFASDPPRTFMATKDGATIDGQSLKAQFEPNKPLEIWIDRGDENSRNDLYDEAEANGLKRSNLPPANGFRLTHLAQGELGIQIITGAEAGLYDLIPGLFIAQQAGVVVRNIGKEDWNPKNKEVIAYMPEFETQARKMEELVLAP
jgi:myo-inositol-1(or 4)-monophosphatase